MRVVLGQGDFAFLGAHGDVCRRFWCNERGEGHWWLARGRAGARDQKSERHTLVRGPAESQGGEMRGAKALEDDEALSPASNHIMGKADVVPAPPMPRVGNAFARKWNKAQAVCGDITW